MTCNCAVLIITRNSELFIQKAMDSIDSQTVKPKMIILVDTGSDHLDYLSPHIKRKDVIFLRGEKDCGFCVGNNIGFQHVPKEIDYVLLQNPDAFLFPSFLENAVKFMESHKACGLVTGKVFGYDIKKNLASGFYDTTGIFKTWYGKWYDRGQGEKINDNVYQTIEEIPAACGALMFCRNKALQQVVIRKNELFDKTFYMYKEDIDLSIRLKKNKWKIFYSPELKAFHCRGWNSIRKMMPRKVRVLSARNECIVQFKTRSPLPFLYSMLKYFSVLSLDI